MYNTAHHRRKLANGAHPRTGEGDQKHCLILLGVYSTRGGVWGMKGSARMEKGGGEECKYGGGKGVHVWRE